MVGILQQPPKKRRSTKRGSQFVMSNTYVAEPEIDELGPNDSVISYSSIVHSKYLLVLLLTSEGDILSYYQPNGEFPQKKKTNIKSRFSRVIEPVTLAISPDGCFIVVALSDCELIVLPTKLVVSQFVEYGDRTSSVISQAPFTISACVGMNADPLKAFPTVTKCLRSNILKRFTIVLATKGGSLFLVDVQSRKCLPELTAPESIHNVDVFQKGNETDIIVTGFTGSQWVIPLENEGRGIYEVLSLAYPTDYRQLDSTISLFVEKNELIVLNTEKNIAECHSSLDLLTNNAHSKFRVPPDTWLVHSSSNCLFVVSGVAELRCAIHFGISDVKLQYAVVRNGCDWRPMGFVPLPQSSSPELPKCLLINERGLWMVKQDPSRSLEVITAEFLFQCADFERVYRDVLAAAALDEKRFSERLVRILLESRKDKRLSAIVVSRITHLAELLSKKMTDILSEFAASNQDHNLLPQVLTYLEKDPKNELKHKVPELFAKKCLANSERPDYEIYRQKKDVELSNFLSQNPDVIEIGTLLLFEARLFKSILLLAARNPRAAKQFLLFASSPCGVAAWNDSDTTMRSLLISTATRLDWSVLSQQELESLVETICLWQIELKSMVHSENCLRIASKYASLSRKASIVLYCVSAICLLSEVDDKNTPTPAEYKSIACGSNNTLITTFDDRLVLFGDLTNKQPRPQDANEISIRGRAAAALKERESNQASSPSPTTSSLSPRTNGREALFPRTIPLESRAHVVACGAEHSLVLTTRGQLYSWGKNSHGQCGTGTNLPIAEPELVQGDWPPIKKLAAGQFHSAALCADGSVWTWGWGLYGQLGIGDRYISDAFVPERIPELSDEVVDLSCGRAHTVLLTKEGRIYVAGSSSYGQYGTCEDVKKIYQFTPVQLPNDLKFVRVATRFYHTVAITDDGQIYEWGRNPQELKLKMFVMRRLYNAQVEQSSNSGRKPTPLPREVPRTGLGWRKIDHLLTGSVEEISTGMSHSAVVTSDGNLFCWGKALDYQLGNGTKTERSEPHQVFEPSVKWKHVQCGAYHTVGVSTDGEVYAWGRNDFMQCGAMSDKAEAPRKFTYKGKDGTSHRIALPDDSHYVNKPLLISDVVARLPKLECENVAPSETELIEKLRSADATELKTISKLLFNHVHSASLPAALVHLLAGNVMRSIETATEHSSKNGQSSSVSAMCSLIWEVVANYEDMQTKELLMKAFSSLQLSATQRNSSQLKAFWPNVWSNESCQKGLIPSEKLAMLKSFAVSVKPITSVEVIVSPWHRPFVGSRCNFELPSGSLRVGGIGARVRVWPNCGHTDVAQVGVGAECTICSDEWAEKARATLGSN